MKGGGAGCGEFVADVKQGRNDSKDSVEGRNLQWSFSDNQQKADFVD
jgi:hypothetical protein